MPRCPKPFSLGYRPALDGLRAVAVLAVLTYHVGWIPGGFLGVDVFFMLSGFLITTLLCEEHARTGTISIRRFYVRRARRLLPALVLFLLICGGILFVTRPSAFWPTLGGNLLGVLSYGANWLIIYWRGLGVFGHTWSLAIEEQFYLAWPLLLLGLLRGARPRLIVAGLVTAAAGSLAWRLALALDGASFARLYAATDTHADGLLVGAALAVWLHHRGVGGSPGRLRRVGGTIATLGLIGLFGAAPLMPGYALGVTALAACATGGGHPRHPRGALVGDPLARGGMAGADRLGVVRRVFVAFPRVRPARGPPAAGRVGGPARAHAPCVGAHLRHR
jgi:peptidoglycan/LPS O-acetylase OafA/YrhL